MNRHERNAALRNASPRMYQDADPEAPARLSFRWWRNFFIMTGGGGLVMYMVLSWIFTQ